MAKPRPSSVGVVTPSTTPKLGAKFTLIILSLIAPSLPLTPRYTSAIAMYYHETEVQVKQEFLIYDLNAIVATIGGSLGLFLGFSCYEVARGGLQRAGNLVKGFLLV